MIWSRIKLPSRQFGWFSLFFVAGLMLVLGSWWYLTKLNLDAKKPDNRAVAPNQTRPDHSTTEAINVALLGYGGEGHQGGQITDTIIVASIYPQAQQVNLISIPRDLWVNLPLNPDLPSKINAAYAIGNDDQTYPNKPESYQGSQGGANLALTSLNQVTGLDIAYFVAVDFSGLLTIIDQLGGLEVEIDRAFVDNYYPIPGREDETCGRSETEIEQLSATLSGFILEKEFECRFETISYPAGKQTLDAEAVLKFVRSRHSDTDGNDFNRARRQQLVINALLDQAFTWRNLTDILTALPNLLKAVTTNINPQLVSQLWPQVGRLDHYQLNSVVLSTDNVLIESQSSDGQYILLPKSTDGDWQPVHQFIQDQAPINPQD